MPDLTLRSFLTGAPAYAAGPGPKLYFGAPVTIGAFLLTQIAAVLIYLGLGFEPSDLIPASQVTPGADAAQRSIFTPRQALVIFQILLILLIFSAPVAAISWPPEGGNRAYAWAIVVMIPMLAILNALAASRSRFTPGQALVTLIFQILLIPLIFAAAAAATSGLRPTLRLGRPEAGLWAYVWAVVTLIPLLAVVNALAYLLRPDDFLADFKIFLDTVRGRWPLVTGLAIGIGAPLWEELLFRGYLLTSATATRIPFWPAAILLNTAWTALHYQYSIVGLIEVFVLGLYFSWLIWRTGSVRVPLFCHALYNCSLFAIMRVLPLG